jgi:hypothetical protein
MTTFPTARPDSTYETASAAACSGKVQNRCDDATVHQRADLFQLLAARAHEEVLETVVATWPAG